MAKIKNLSEILPPELQEAQALPLDDHMDIPLVFHGCREVTGNNGAYMRMSVSHPDEDEQFYLSTGASQPMAVLQWVKDNNAFPFIGKFTTAGRAKLLVGVDDKAPSK